MVIGRHCRAFRGFRAYQIAKYAAKKLATIHPSFLCPLNRKEKWSNRENHPAFSYLVALEFSLLMIIVFLQKGAQILLSLSFKWCIHWFDVLFLKNSVDGYVKYSQYPRVRIELEKIKGLIMFNRYIFKLVFKLGFMHVHKPFFE